MEDRNERIPSLEYSSEELNAISERDGIGEIPPPFKDAWVIFVDVDGFSKAMCDSQRRVKVAHKYWDLAGRLLDGAGHHRQRYVSGIVRGVDKADLQRDLEQRLVRWRRRVNVFSDSIFIFLDQSTKSGGVPEDETLDGKFVAGIASQLSGMLWEDRFPHRGAVAFGDCLLDPARGVFVGEAIVRAVKWAEAQAWFGISIEPHGPSLAQAEQDFDQGHATTGCSVPFSRKCADDIQVVSTTIANSLGFNQTERPLEGLIGAFGQAKDLPDRVRNRYKETARIWLRQSFFKKDVSLWKELASLAGGAGDIP